MSDTGTPQKDAPTETYSIIATLTALALNHAGGLIGDKEFHKKVEEETINLLCCVEAAQPQ